jgi:RES domain-containing protein
LSCNLEHRELTERRAFRGLAYRHTRPVHADLSATIAATARTTEPGRFHIAGDFGAIYLSLDSETALRELARRAQRVGIPIRHLMPRDLVTVELRLANVLDLSDANGLNAAMLASDDLVACQEVAAAARRAGYEAIIYPSATGTGENLALFYDHLHPGSSAVVAGQRAIDLETLPDV